MQLTPSRTAFTLSMTRFICISIQPRSPTALLLLFSLGLVRVLYLVAMLLGACAATHPLQIVGPYAARLSRSDIEQIKSLAEDDETEGTLRKLEVVHPDRVRVEKGKETRYTRFTVMRHHGHWIVDERVGGEAVAT